MSIKELIKNRKSHRTFNGEKLSGETIEKLMKETEETSNPFNISIRFEFLDQKEYADYDLSTLGIVNGCETFVAGAVSRNNPFSLVAFGYEFEKFCLHALDLGLGTVMLAATLNREAFQQAIQLQDDEIMPTITPVGYYSEFSDKESRMRKGLKSDARRDFEEIFFNKDFNTPLSKEDSGIFYDSLEMLRLAPSSNNGQPWSVIKDDDLFHFFRVQNPEKIMPGVSEIKLVDVGIAMSHFDLTRKEDGIKGEWIDYSDKLDINSPSGIDYIYSFQAE